MTAAIQHRTRGPAHPGQSRFFACPRARRHAPRFRTARPEKRVGGQKTASGIFFPAPSKTRRENVSQTLGTHQENYVWAYDFASGCAVALNSGTQITRFNLPNGNTILLGAPGQAGTEVRYAPNGNLTLGEANAHYTTGNGVPVIVDASLYDFSNVNPNGFNAQGTQTYTFPHFQGGTPSNDFLVNGTVTLKLDSGGQTFTVLPDRYDFDMHSWTAQPVRNGETIIANVLADPMGNRGVPFDIVFQGSVPVPAPAPGHHP